MHGYILGGMPSLFSESSYTSFNSRSVGTTFLLTHTNLCPLGNFSHFLYHLLIFFKINFLEKIFQDYDQSVKQFESRSGPTYCRA